MIFHKLLSASLSAQGGNSVVDPYWVAISDGISRSTATAGTDSAFSSAIDSSGNIIVTGWANLSGVFVATITKYSIDGQILWQTLLNRSGINTTSSQIAIDSSDNIIVAGGTNNGSGIDEIFIAKYNSSGTLQWQRLISGPDLNPTYFYNERYITALHVDSSGSIYIGTRCGDNTVHPDIQYANFDGIIIKYDSSGTFQWQRLLGPIDVSFLGSNIISINSDTTGNIVVAGYHTNSVVIVKYNTSGSILSQYRYNNALASNLSVGVLDSSDNMYISGYISMTDGQGVKTMRSFITKINSSNTIVWEKQGQILDETNVNIVVSNGLKPNADGYLYECINVYRTTFNYALVNKYDTNGNLIWCRKIETTESTATGVFDAKADTNGNVFLSGRVTLLGVNSTSTFDSFFARFPSDGSGTGTYGPIVYSTDNYTISGASGSVDSPSPSITEYSTTNLTFSTSTFTSYGIRSFYTIS